MFSGFSDNGFCFHNFFLNLFGHKIKNGLYNDKPFLFSYQTINYSAQLPASFHCLY
ncbi:hypothetical protein PPHE_a2897 [Pseudoalteromonas phenolica O-BC30]|nr:hypothetical protein [Pseudoalteromonas phenolica O-BC30]